MVILKKKSCSQFVKLNKNLFLVGNITDAKKYLDSRVFHYFYGSFSTRKINNTHTLLKKAPFKADEYT